MDYLVLKMFKSHDIRIKQKELSKQIKYRLYNAVAVYLKDSLKVSSAVICRDARLGAPEVAEGLKHALIESGLDVLINPLPVSTCQFYFSCMQNRDSAGLMVTASHNPGEYVGIKFTGPDLTPISSGHGPDGGIDGIKNLYLSNSSFKSEQAGNCKVINYLESYISKAMELSGVTEGSLSGMKVLFEFLSGSAGAEFALAFQKAGADVTFRNIVPDGFFRQGDPNPIIESSVGVTRKAMRDGSYDLGFIFDGDGDRMDLMYPDGVQVIPGLNMSVIMPYLITFFKDKRDFYADAKALPVSLCQLAKAGCNVHIIRNGHSFIKHKLMENFNKGYFGSVEESAHYYICLPFDQSDHSKGWAATESTLFYALLSAKAMKDNPQSYREIRAIQDNVARIREWTIKCEMAPEKMPQILKEVQDVLVAQGAQVITEMEDGSDLEATLMRFGLPDHFDKDTDLSNTKWGQVAQRISASEDALVRFEITSSDMDFCRQLDSMIRSVTDRYVQHDWAKY